MANKVNAKSTRQHQAAELIQRTIASLIHAEVQDPRLSKATITGVDVSPDFKQSTVFFTQLDSSEKAVLATETAFKKASGYFRSKLSAKTELRYVPHLTFKFDKTVMDAERIAKLLG